MADRKKVRNEARPHETLFSPHDIAQYFRVNYYTVRHLRHAGRLPQPDVTIGNRPRWKWETIQQLMEKQTI